MNWLGWLGTFAMSAVTALTLVMDASMLEFNSARVAVVLLVVALLHVVRFGRIVVRREAVFYACFLAYMLVQLLWTDDRAFALNTLMPATNFLLVLLIFGSFVAFHELRAVLAGALAGFLLGAAYYTATSGFPFRYPAEFSYNAIASMYLFGFILTLFLATLARRRAALLVLAVVVAVHIVATTSIKANVGIALGVAGAALIHFSHVSRMLWRNALVILAVGAVVAVSIASNEAAVERIRSGAGRVELGIQILLAREDLPGYSAFEKRASWQREGFRGWADNPVFGHGVETFRAERGFTSHASHVDIAYNSGLIGLVLFYAIFVSVFMRLYRARNAGFQNARIVILGAAIAYLFISFAGTIYYLATLAAFLALGIGVLKRA